MVKYIIASRTFGTAICICCLGLVVLLISGNESMASNYSRIDLKKVPVERWNALGNKSIFFGHQSVGYNILDGVKMVKANLPAVKLEVTKLTEPVNFNPKVMGVLFHAQIGTNFDPHSKIDDFVTWMDSGIGGNVDYAFLKFCFVDIGTRTDLQALFSYYKKTMAELKAKYPGTTIVHFTVPLVVEKIGFSKWKHKIKNIVKQIFGKNEYYENLNKFYFNEMIRAEYKGREPVFDLAAIESTLPDGSRLITSVAGTEIESLAPVYSSDGGHLSTEGKKNVASALLTLLANLK